MDAPPADAIPDDTYAHDAGKNGEGRPPDQVIHIDGLDEASIADWWRRYKKNPTWDFSKRNCSQTVVDAINAGIPRVYHPPSPPKPWPTTSPSDAAGYANAVKKLLQSPPPATGGGGGW